MAFPVASSIITCVICYGIFKIVELYLRRRRLYKLAAKFDGPPTLPFIGNAHQLAGNSEYRLNKLIELADLYPSPSRVWLGPVLVFLTNDPEQAKAICLSSKILKKGSLFSDFCGPLLGTGLLTAPVLEWKVHRKLIQPTFNAKILDSFVEVFVAQSKILTGKMERNLDGPEFEIFNLLSSCTFDMICETAMGVKIASQTNRNCNYVKATQEVLSVFCKRIFSPWLHPDLIFHLLQLGRQQRKCIKFLQHFTGNVIQEKRKELSEGSSQTRTTDNEDDAYESVPRKKAFLDHLMTLPQGSANFSDEALCNEIQTMVFAGHDTTAVANSNVILMLASHPDIQEKAHRELHEIYGDDDSGERSVTSKDLPRMKYLERVIKETLRLFPSAPFIIRDVTEDFDIGDHTLPNGSSVIIEIIAMHRNEKYWPDPLKFDPDRFLPEEIAKRHPYAFMPFSAGQRNCIGLNYAMLSMKALLATLLRKYIFKKDKIASIKDIGLQMEITLKSADPVKIRIERRSRN